jgi:hypothetical protein
MSNCGNKKKNLINAHGKKYRNYDTLRMPYDSATILLYSLSQAEYDSLSLELKSEYDEGYADFLDLLSTIKNKIPKKVLIKNTASDIIFIGHNIVNRHKLQNSEYGVILIKKDGGIEILQGDEVSDIKTALRNL